jgi:hypothetical protein
LCVGATRLGLFTGEDARPAATSLCCQGLTWTANENGGGTLEFAGPCLTFPRTDPFLDLEDGLADAELSRLDAKLEWRPLLPASSRGRARTGTRLGWLDGRVHHGGSTATIAAPAALREGSPGETPDWRERRVLQVPLGAESFLSISSRLQVDETIDGEIVRAGVLEPLLSGRVTVRKGADGLTPEAWRIEAVSRSGPLRVFGQVTHAVPVVRPARDGRVLMFFGLGRFDGAGHVGFGTFELSQVLAAHSAAADQKGRPQ